MKRWSDERRWDDEALKRLGRWGDIGDEHWWVKKIENDHDEIFKLLLLLCFEFNNKIYPGSFYCQLTNIIINPNTKTDCQYHNKNLSQLDICYNCKYYGGIGDWGLFCHHKDMYHHLGKFNDKSCENFERRY